MTEQPQSTEMTFTFEGEQYALDVADLLVSEWEDMEEVADVSLVDMDKRTTKFMSAMAWVAIRRERPEVTIEQIRGQKFMSLIGGIEATTTDPTVPAEA